MICAICCAAAVLTTVCCTQSCTVLANWLQSTLLMCTLPPTSMTDMSCCCEAASVHDCVNALAMALDRSIVDFMRLLASLCPSESPPTSALAICDSCELICCCTSVVTDDDDMHFTSRNIVCSA